jgi:photosynthetic reaction center cytochrome c subunit
MRTILSLTGLTGIVLLAGCEAPPMVSEQLGYRGSGVAQISNPDRALPADVIPPPPYPLGPDEGPRASETYENVRVLGDLSTDEFNRLMLSMTEWVSPEQGCNYCHNAENMASDEVYTKVVARRMLQMTREINSMWKPHVQTTGVTCYTCHRGKPVPAETWSLSPEDPKAGRLVAANMPTGQNRPQAITAYASLPAEPFAKYLQGDASAIRVASASGRPHPDWTPSIKDAEATYGLMMHLSSALGVNCTFCHNTQSFRNWSTSRAQRATAWHGIRMTGKINAAYITPLQSTFPAARLGPAGDPLKVNCATCHRGKSKPLGGVSMLADHPALAGVRQTAAVVPAATDSAGVAAPESAAADADAAAPADTATGEAAAPTQ